MFFKQFGGKITAEDLARYQQSEQWRDGRFQNIEHTELATSLLEMPAMIYKQLNQGKEKEPSSPLPVVPFDRDQFLSPSDHARLIWYGHSVVLMRILEQTILIDPMLGPDTTPIAPMKTQRFSENTLDLIDDFPQIDLLVLTHDHYDHLDYVSIQKLKSKTSQYFVALGVKRHLVNWGVSPDRIQEFDWWDGQEWNNIQITFTPTRHFSGRGLRDRQKSLWGGWNFKTSYENIWFSGDGGYGKHFSEIGKRLGPFDFAFMESGQYNEDWRPIHLFPDESVRAAQDAGARKIMPVHWAGFALSYQHGWKDPAELFVESAVQMSVDFLTPRLGQVFNIYDTHTELWWREYG